MLQEVQTWVWIYNESTLETIEAIGTSSFKIVEWRQTKGGHYISSATGEWMAIWDYVDTWPRQWPMVVSTDMTITSSSWQASFAVANNWLRVPRAWTYEVTVDRRGWSSTYSGVMYAIRGTTENDEILYTKSFSANYSEVITFNVDLGKFEVITIWGKFYYSWTAHQFWPRVVYKLTVKQL